MISWQITDSVAPGALTGRFFQQADSRAAVGQPCFYHETKTKPKRPKMKGTNRKIKCLRAWFLTLATGGIALVSGCAVQPKGQVALYFPTVAFAPAVVVEPVMVPEAYTWDGVEYVGLVGDQCFYLGPGDVWLVAGPDRLERFHGWESSHRDSRSHATSNDRFRKDAHGRVQPRRNEKRT